MLIFALKRLALAIPLILVVATITFFLIQLIPGSPAGAILGGHATRAQVAALNHTLGLDRPVMTQYLDWCGHAVRFNFGDSFLDGTPVTTKLTRALAPTLSLALLSTALTLAVGLVLGMLAAVRGGATDRAVQALCSLGMAIPPFWLAVMLIYVLAIKVHAFPVGTYEPLTSSPAAWLAHLILPALALSAVNLGQVTFQARAAFQEALSRDYVRTLLATGVPRRKVLFKHVLRNGAVPVVTVTGLAFIFTLGGVVVLELIFNLSGLGFLVLSAVTSHDYAVVEGAVVLFAVVVVVVNLVVDLVTAALDPRVRLR